MSEEYTPENINLENLTPEQLWKLGWSEAKLKAAAKIMKKKDEWKQRATSDEAEVEYVKGVVQAVKTQRRKKALEEVDPNYWAKRTTKRIMETELTDEQARKWASKSAPYRELVKWASEKLKEKGYTGVDAAQIWVKEVLPRLKRARGRPEIIPRIRAELEQFFMRLKPKVYKPEQVEVVIKTG